MDKKLYRSEDNKIFLGICGGIGEYFSVDPVVIRVIFVGLIFAGFSGILAYIVAAFVVPKPPAGGKNHGGSDSGRDPGTIYEEYSSKFNTGNHNE